ncbi:GAF domain-containing sensor histidine kinase [Variovorax sp. J2P1-59]|uniref:sensor histidine kinase n=1 Tax=Variovorax flavidus TaxID=3053501 RepID=UPI002577015B|nr:GAF domain-containing sensor histidine kinase [Variovorax sp. J2P1-59]MDM0078489.1 GAF domain-containing sensor histidine kinase [Variovorax sp. J2P1-59]
MRAAPVGFMLCREEIVMLTPENLSGLLREIDATALLPSRPRRTPDWRAEAEAWERLTDVFINKSAGLAQALVDTALNLTGAQAAGISVDEPGAHPHVFRWVATAGTYACYLNGTMPYDFSPCGEVVKRNAPVLMREMHKLYAYVSELHKAPHEVLLVPFHRDGVPVGTVWIVHHNDEQLFDAGDLRIVQKLTRFAGAAVDHARHLQRLSHANEVMREVDLRKDQFMAVLAHEMRNPLGTISLGMQVIKRAGDDPQRRVATIASVERQVNQLSSLVRDMTDAAAIRNGKLTLYVSNVCVQQLIASAIETCQEAMQAKRQRLDVRAPDQPLLVNGDAARLTQVFVNLLNNAIKYTPDEGEISVVATRRGTDIEVCVTDSGIGLDAVALPKVFDMYMQVPMNDRPPDSGLGIGLALVKELVEMHDGAVAVTSAGLDQGTSFRVTLPDGAAA